MKRSEKSSGVLEQLFEQEELIQKSIKDIAQGILDLSDFVTAKGPLELANAQIVGKRMRRSCDIISDEVHLARKKLGILMLETKSVVFKKSKRALTEMENELSLIHGDVDAIGKISEEFYGAIDRKSAFANVSRHYEELVEHAMSLMVVEGNLKKRV